MNCILYLVIGFLFIGAVFGGAMRNIIDPLPRDCVIHPAATSGPSPLKPPYQIGDSKK